MLAFAAYMAITVHINSHLAAPLVTYMTIIAHLAWEVQGQAWLRYDKLFRRAATVNPVLSWDCREPDVWLVAMSEQPRVAAPSLSTTHSMTPRSWSKLQKICKRFIWGECSSPLSYKFWHACMLCKSLGYPAKHCYMLRPQQGGLLLLTEI